jgi:hypothetical protein
VTIKHELTPIFSATNHFDQSFTSLVLHSLEFDYPTSPAHSGNPLAPEREWWCINGGTGTIIPKMKEKINKSVLFTGHRVKAIEVETFPSVKNRPIRVTAEKKAATTACQPQGQAEGSALETVHKNYTHVITTTTTSCLQVMDLRNAGLSYAQREAIRVLRYDNSVKVGIKFSERWWADRRGIDKGGLGMTDRPTRVVVYPSYALNTKRGEPGVLLACYNWAQDAQRLGNLIQGSDPTDQPALISVILADLAAMHDMDEQALRKLMIEYHVHDWFRDERIGGAFGMFGPGQFATFFAQIQRPAAGGRLFFAGELTSIYHGWIVASLNSARRAVGDMLNSRLLQAQARDDMERMRVDLLREYLRRNWDFGPREATQEMERLRGWQCLLAKLSYEGNLPDM